MDKEIRNKLRNAVTHCRTILERAIGEILQGQLTSTTLGSWKTPTR